MSMIPTLKQLIQSTKANKIIFVNSLIEFEKAEFEIDTTCLAIDNFVPSFYIRSRAKNGEYSSIKVYFYEDIALKVQNLKHDEFVEKCRKAELNETDIKIAEKIYIDNLKNDELWDWLLRNKIKDVELDTIRKIKWRIKVKLYPELIKHKKKT